eukprot:2619500-Rhodomonas_salina.1
MNSQACVTFCERLCADSVPLIVVPPQAWAESAVEGVVESAGETVAAVHYHCGQCEGGGFQLGAFEVYWERGGGVCGMEDTLCVYLCK